MSLTRASGALAEKLSVLRGALQLSPYEVRCIDSLLRGDQHTAKSLAEEARVPRSRVYDVLGRLSVRGLVVKTPGRPTQFSLVDPRFGLVKSVEERHRAVLGELELERKIVLDMAEWLSSYQGEVLRSQGSKEIGWTIGPAAAAMAYHIQLKRSCQESYSGISNSPAVPPEALFAEERQMLKRGVKARLVRPFPSTMVARHRSSYRELLRQGFQIRDLRHPDISFDVFDRREVLLWLDEDNRGGAGGVTWIRHAGLARVMELHFETVWASAPPVKP